MNYLSYDNRGRHRRQEAKVFLPMLAFFAVATALLVVIASTGPGAAKPTPTVESRESIAVAKHELSRIRQLTGNLKSPSSLDDMSAIDWMLAPLEEWVALHELQDSDNLDDITGIEWMFAPIEEWRCQTTFS